MPLNINPIHWKKTMAKPIKLSMGRSTLEFTPSDELVAVADDSSTQRNVGVAPAARTIAAAASIGGEEVMKLGGFRVISVANESVTASAAVRRLRLDPVAPASAKVYHTSDDGVPFIPTGEIYLEFAEGTPAEESNRILAESQLEYLKKSGKQGVVVRLVDGDAVELCAKLQEESSVNIAEPSFATPAAIKGAVAPAQLSLPADALLSRQWHLENVGQIDGSSIGLLAGADARVIAAWRASQQLGDSDITVAVIDDGFDIGHPDLGPSSRIVSPFDFTRNSTDVRPGPGRVPVPGDPGGDWHGTACAGVAVSRADADGVVGAAPNCKLMPVRWGPYINDTQIENWFSHVTDNGADVVSCSWGVQARVFELSTRMHNAIEECATNGRGGLGCVVCFAAGNENRDIDDYPNSLDGFATHPNVIAVAASTSVDTKAHYSNFGEAISICAPSSGAGGRGVLTADVRGTYVATDDGNTYEAGYSPGAFTPSFGGTSSACPLVAGICALVLSLDASLTAAQVKSLLESNARRIGSNASYGTDGHSNLFGFGCVDAEAVVLELLQQDGNASPQDIAWKPAAHTQRT